MASATARGHFQHQLRAVRRCRRRSRRCGGWLSLEELVEQVKPLALWITPSKLAERTALRGRAR